jgi:hypothetical protein
LLVRSALSASPISALSGSDARDATSAFDRKGLDEVRAGKHPRMSVLARVVETYDQHGHDTGCVR